MICKQGQGRAAPAPSRRHGGGGDPGYLRGSATGQRSPGGHFGASDSRCLSSTTGPDIGDNLAVCGGRV